MPAAGLCGVSTGTGCVGWARSTPAALVPDKRRSTTAPLAPPLSPLSGIDFISGWDHWGTLRLVDHIGTAPVCNEAYPMDSPEGRARLQALQALRPPMFPGNNTFGPLTTPKCVISNAGRIDCWNGGWWLEDTVSGEAGSPPFKPLTAHRARLLGWLPSGRGGRAKRKQSSATRHAGTAWTPP